MLESSSWPWRFGRALQSGSYVSIVERFSITLENRRNTYEIFMQENVYGKYSLTLQMLMKHFSAFFAEDVITIFGLLLY